MFEEIKDWIFEDYWVYDGYLIFKPEFTGELNDKLITKYNKILFSNYMIPKISIRLNNQISIDYGGFYCDSKFNRNIILQNYIITHLIFGTNFNSNVILSNHISHLTFGFAFNKPIILPNHISHLTFGSNFNQPVNLPSSIQYLSLGHYFNQEVKLPFGLKYLKLDVNNQFVLDNLVDSIEELEFDYYFDLELNNLPNSINKIIFNNYSIYKKDLNSLADSIEYIKLPSNYKKKLFCIPKSLKVISCHKKYKYIDDFPKHIRVETFL
jgi:hypothetical protein